MKSNRWLMFVAVLVVIAIAVAASFKFGKHAPVHVSGTVGISEDLARKAQGINTMFIVLYGEGQRMPLGAMREHVSNISGGTFHSFVVTPDRLQLMGQQTPVPPTFRMKIRLDADGSAGMDSRGDIVGEVASVARGSTGVHIQLSRLVE